MPVLAEVSVRGSVQLDRLGLIAVLLWALPASASAAEGLNLFPNPALLVVNLVLLGVLIWPVNKLLVSPIVSILREREARTTGSTEEADAILADAQRERDALEQRRLVARRNAAERRNEILAAGKIEEQQLVDAARADAAAALADVRSSVEAELHQARESLRADARALAEEAASRILGRPL